MFLISGGIALAFNQRIIAEILEMIAMLSRIVDKQAEGEALVRELGCGLEAIMESAKKFPRAAVKKSVYLRSERSADQRYWMG